MKKKRIEDNNVSKRVNLTLAESVYRDLEKWAEQQGRPVANLANYLIEKAVEDAKRAGEISEDDITVGQAALEFLKRLSNGQRPKNSELVKLAHVLDVELEQLLELCDRLFIK